MSRYYTNSEIRDYISCPQFGDNKYGKWGGLKLEVRECFMQLISSNECMDNMLKDRLLRIDKALRILSKHNKYLDYEPWSVYKVDGQILFNLVNVLLGEDNDE